MADKKTQQMLEEIRIHLRKKDYYQILGVTKSADDKQIKNAYRKLALRFHPDKNQVEGSKQVFKKVSNAYSTLIDVEKRSNYDRYGPEQTIQAQRQQQYAQQRQYYANEDQQFQFIFRQFFGGGGNVFYQQQQHHRMTPEQQRERQKAQQAQSNNLKWMALIFFLLMFVPRFFQSKPDFSLNYSSDYNTMRTTSILKNKFYINQGFNPQPNKLLQIQRQVDYQHVKNIINKCQNSRRIKQNYDQNAAMSIFQNSKTYYQKMSASVDMGYCNKWSNLQNNHPNYISQLVYIR